MKSNFSAILLAAGMSSRMGKLKALLPWKGKPLIQYQLDQMIQAGTDEIIVVLGYQADRLKKETSPYNIQVTINEDYQGGKASSIRQGAACLEGVPKGIFIHSVDQPVPCETLILMKEHLRNTGASIVIPVYRNKRGHPILFDGGLKSELLRVNEESKGLRDVIRSYQSDIAYLTVEDASVLFNFNRPEEYLRRIGGLQ